MHPYALSHLSDAVLLRDLVSLVSQDRRTTSLLLAHIAEVDARKLYLPAGYTSMHAYCVEELRLSEDAAYMRIRAGRAAREFPVLFGAVAEGRLHLTGVCQLAPYLTEGNVDDLVSGATGQRKSDIEAMLARRFPLVGELPATVRPAAGVSHPLAQHARNGLNLLTDNMNDTTGEDPRELVLERVEDAVPVVPRFTIQVTVDESTREKLQHAQALLSHAVPSGDVAEVLDRALDALIKALEKRKVGVGRRTRAGQAPRGRYVPTHIRRAVWERDGGQCTFVSASGHRCAARRFLEFDHVDPVARGGEATVDRMRLRCRAHNQYEAERAFGAEFIAKKRQVARHEADVVAGLRGLGFRAGEARRAVEQTKSLEGAAIEERLRAAIQLLGRAKAEVQRAPASG